MNTEAKAAKSNLSQWVRSAVMIAFWLLLILLCFIHRDKITVETILSFTPQNTTAAILVMLCLFAVKSVLIFVYGGILYAASGVLFPLPLAVFVNFIGTIIMTTIPFFIGRKMGSNAVMKITDKHPKLKILGDLSNKNELFISFFVRIFGCLPADPLGMYLGATGMRYSRYLLGTLLGLTSAIICFSIMGTSIDDVSSPAFMISTAVEVGLMLLSITLYLIWKIKNKKKSVSARLEQNEA